LYANKELNAYKMSIFISIASYQDPLLVSTIFGAYNNAQNKKDLIFSVCDQSDSPVNFDELEFANQIKYEHIDPIFSKGPCWARHRAQSFYAGEKYFLQIDSHTQFSPDWDILFEDAFLKMLLSNFRFFETRTNSKNYFSVFEEYQQKRDIQVIDLKQPYETILSRFRRDRKKDLRKAKRSELNMKIENNLDKFINLYKLNVGKKVKKIKEIDYYNLKLLITACIDKKKGEILSVYDGEGNLVAAGFFLKDKERVVKLVSSTDYNNRKNGANTFLIEKAVRKYYEAFDLFDFGGSSVKSIASFNLSFGAHTENYLQLKYNGLPKILKLFKK
jgi:hypothetical protein